MGVIKVSDSKSDLQGHSRSLYRCHSTGYIRFPISIPLQLYPTISNFYPFRNIIVYLRPIE